MDLEAVNKDILKLLQKVGTPDKMAIYTVEHITDNCGWSELGAIEVFLDKYIKWDSPQQQENYRKGTWFYSSGPGKGQKVPT